LVGKGHGHTGDTWVIEKWEKGWEDLNLGHTVETGVVEKWEIGKEDLDLGHTVETEVAQQWETEQDLGPTVQKGIEHLNTAYVWRY